jgi:hypothetical protein
MDNKILVNHSIVTESWKISMGKIGLFIVMIPYALLIIPAGLIWFLSLGHVYLVGIWLQGMEWVYDRIYG